MRPRRSQRLVWWMWSALSVAFFMVALCMLEVKDGSMAALLLSLAGGYCLLKANEEE